MSYPRLDQALTLAQISATCRAMQLLVAVGLDPIDVDHEEALAVAVELSRSTGVALPCFGGCGADGPPEGGLCPTCTSIRRSLSPLSQAVVAGMSAEGPACAGCGCTWRSACTGPDGPCAWVDLSFLMDEPYCSSCILRGLEMVRGLRSTSAGETPCIVPE